MYLVGWFRVPNSSAAAGLGREGRHGARIGQRISKLPFVNLEPSYGVCGAVPISQSHWGHTPPEYPEFYRFEPLQILSSGAMSPSFVAEEPRLLTLFALIPATLTLSQPQGRLCL